MEKSILSTVLYRDIEVLKHKAVHKGELCFEGLYIDKRKRIVVRKKMKLT